MAAIARVLIVRSGRRYRCGRVNVDVARDGRVRVVLMAGRMASACCTRASAVSMLVPLGSSDAIHQKHRHEAQDQRGAHGRGTAIQIDAFLARVSVAVSGARFGAGLRSGMIVRGLCFSVVQVCRVIMVVRFFERSASLRHGRVVLGVDW